MSLRGKRPQRGVHGAEKQGTAAVLRRRPFLLLWLGSMISNGGDWILTISLPVYVYDMTHSTPATGVLVMAQSLPRLLLGLGAGVFVDRYDRRRIVIAAQIGEAVLLLLLVPARAPGALPLVYIVAALMATLALFSEPGMSALIPSLVSPEEIVAANGMCALGWEFARLGAPPLGGLLLATTGLAGVALVDSASFVASAALLASIGPGQGSAMGARDCLAGRANRTTIRQEILVGLRTVGQSRRLVVLLTVGCLTMVAEGIMNVLGFPWIVAVLRGGAMERGWLATAQGIGGITGGLVLRGLRQSPPGCIIGTGSLLFGIASLLLTNCATVPIPAESRWPLALLLKGLSGAPLLVLMVGVQTLLVRSVDDRLRGRVLALYGVASGCALLGGQLVASLLGDRLGVVQVLSLQGILYVLAGCVAFTLIPAESSLDARAVHDTSTRGIEGLR